MYRQAISPGCISSTVVARCSRAYYFIRATGASRRSTFSSWLKKKRRKRREKKKRRNRGWKIETRGKEAECGFVSAIKRIHLESLSRTQLINRRGISCFSLYLEDSSRKQFSMVFIVVPRRKNRPTRYSQPRCMRFLSREIMQPLVDCFHGENV